MSHLKRQSVPKSWPIKRKGTTYIVRPNLGLSNSLPILIILRDLLKIAQNRKEVKKMIHMKSILVNGKEVRDEKEGILLFDVITLKPSKQSYRLVVLKNEKLNVEAIKDDDSNSKVAKIIGKTVLKGKKMQLNLSDGRNFISDLKCKVGDSVVINLNNRKIEKLIVLKEKSKVIVFAGKHSGEVGEIGKIDEERKIAEIKKGEDKINVLIKQLMAIE